jgi:hypothetical protein
VGERQITTVQPVRAALKEVTQLGAQHPCQRAVLADRGVNVRRLRTRI